MRIVKAMVLVLAMAIQPQESFSQIPSRAEKHFLQAMEWHRQAQPEKAEASMRQAIRLHPSYHNAYSLLSAWLFGQRNYEEAAGVLEQAMAALPKQRQAFILPLARCRIYQGKAREALSLIQSHPQKENPEWVRLRDQALFLSLQPPSSPQDSLHHLEPRVNSPRPEMAPSISTDTQTLYFSRPSPRGDWDLYYAHRDSCGGWFKALPFGSPPNTRHDEFAQMISADGHYIFFTRSDARSESGWGRGGHDLYMAYTGDSVWTVPQSFGATINTSAYEGTPCLSADNRELYFSSNRPGGYGGLDLWVSRFEGGLWQAPRNLGPEINTPGDETMPFLHLDNGSLFFSSDGHPGFGGKDLFVSQRRGDSLWAPPRNLGAPYNSPANESGISLDIWGHRAWISSDRQGIEGEYDLYSCRVPDQWKPRPVVILRGYTLDSLQGSRLTHARIQVRQAHRSRPLYQFVSNRGDGSYMITLPLGEDYTLHTSTVHYRERIDSLRLGNLDSTFHWTRNLALLPQGYQPPTRDSLLLVVRYEKNQLQLTDTMEQQILDKVDPWINEEGIFFQVDGYTDNSGTPLINETYSSLRARQIRDLILSRGQALPEVQTMGWGEENPLTSNETEEGRDWNRRVEIRVHFPDYR